jgi:hypothetical protein
LVIVEELRRWGASRRALDGQGFEHRPGFDRAFFLPHDRDEKRTGLSARRRIRLRAAGPRISDMDDLETFDPALFGIWERAPTYGEPMVMDDAALRRKVRSVPLETKSAERVFDPAEELRRLLNEMTVEMRDQFATFRALRASAEKALVDGDEAAQKLARADVKAATDAMSLIVRTLEKVDGLQRQLARDREAEAERTADNEGYEAAKARFMRMIHDRAHEEAVDLFEAWKRDGPPPDIVEKPERRAEKPADDSACGGEECGQADGGYEALGARNARDHGDT